MSHSRHKFPKLLHHKPSGRAYVMASHPDGGRKAVYFGAHGSPEAEAEYNRFIRRLAAGRSHGEKAGTPAPVADATLNELVVDFFRHATGYYREGASELATFRLVLTPLTKLYGDLPADEFGPRRLKEFREGLVGQGLSRSEVNRRVGMVKRMFRWLASEELVPVGVYQSLATVAGLKRWRTTAAEPVPITTVAEAVVDATLPFLTRHAAGLVRFLRFSVCRPGEACRVRLADVRADGEGVWLYQPAEHKTAYRGKLKEIRFGKQGWALVQEFATADPSDYLFSPRRSVEEVRAKRAAGRATPKFPSHMERNEAKRAAAPKRAPGKRYTASSLAKAVRKAVKRANRDRRPDDQLPYWHPNQMRHTGATAVRDRHGAEAAQIVMGHEHLSTTEIYAEKNRELARKVARERG